MLPKIIRDVTIHDMNLDSCWYQGKEWLFQDVSSTVVL